MAKVEKTEREKRWDKVWHEYLKSIADPANKGASQHRIHVAIAAKLRVPLSTVKDIVARKEASNG